MESAAARKRVVRPYVFPPALFDFPFARFEWGGVDPHQGLGGPAGGFLRDPAAQAAVLEARVARPVVLEPPAEDLLIELFRAADVGRAELDVVDPPVVIRLRHRAPSQRVAFTP